MAEDVLGPFRSELGAARVLVHVGPRQHGHGLSCGSSVWTHAIYYKLGEQGIERWEEDGSHAEPGLLAYIDEELFRTDLALLRSVAERHLRRSG